MRLRAFEELLVEEQIDESTVMIQIATPSRERVEHYTRMRNDIEQTVGRINGAYSRVGHPVLHYLHQSMPREELVAFFAAADVMLVTPLRDGMNLVAKEYVACRHDDGGVLVLSEFAGAAIELKDAVLVNPHDTDGVKDALHTALTMDPAEARRRMRAMRRQVLTHDVDRWARSFLDALGPALGGRRPPDDRARRGRARAGRRAPAAGRPGLRRRARADRAGALRRPPAAGRGGRDRGAGRAAGHHGRAACPGAGWPTWPRCPGSGRRCT